MSSPFGKIVLVPMHVDALFVFGHGSLNGGLNVAGPTIDFSKLPYGSNTAKPFLGKSIVRIPFQITDSDQSTTADEMLLENGVHLHWSLPDALTRTMSLPIVRKETFISAFGLEFPVVNGSNVEIVSNGENIWQELLRLQWISPLPNAPVLARVKPRMERLQTLDQASNLVKDRLNSLDSLLDQSAFPAVPTCWWVNTFLAGKDWSAGSPDAQNLVVSDIVVNQTSSNTPCTSLPITDPIFKLNSQQLISGKGKLDNDKAIQTFDLDRMAPFQTIGYNYTYKSWGNQWVDGDGNPWDPSVNTPGTYLANPLTAVGGGDPTFAAFYPNCRSIFGFFDNQNSGNAGEIKYEVLGWYRQANLDYFRFFVQDFIQSNPGDYLGLLKAVKDSFSWLIPIVIDRDTFCQAVWNNLSIKPGSGQTAIQTDVWQRLLDKQWLAPDASDTTKFTISVGALTDDANNQLGISFAYAQPAINTVLNAQIQDQLGPLDKIRILCYGTVSLTIPNTDDSSNFPVAPPQIQTVAVGNTGSEALSALLANGLSGKHKPELEDYLEALQLFASQGNRQLDIGAKFAQARHEKGFTAESGGTIWSVRSMSSTASKADSSHQSTEVNLPDALAEQLNDLNLLQAQVDSLDAGIADVRKQIFADWAKYLECKYFDDGITTDKAPADSNALRTYYIPKIWQPRLDDLIQQRATAQGKLSPQLQALANAVVQLQLLDIDEVKNWYDLTKSLMAGARGNNFTKLQSLLSQPNIQQDDLVEAINELLKRAALYQQLIPAGLAQEAQLLLQKGVTKWTADDRQQFRENAAGILPQEAIAILVNASLNPATDWLADQQLRYNRLLLQTICPDIAKKPWYTLQSKGAPRFWMPNEPVLLFTGDAAVEPPRFAADGRLGKDNLLDIRLTDASEDWTNNLPSADQITAITTALVGIANNEPGHFAFNKQTADPWNPFVLEWEVQLIAPKKTGATFRHGNMQQYKNDFLTSYYQLQDNSPELLPNNTLDTALSGSIPDISTYTGYTVITPHAAIQLKRKIANYLIQLLGNQDLSQFYQKNPALEKQPISDWIDNLQALGFGPWFLSQKEYSTLAEQLALGSSDPIVWLQTPANMDKLIQIISAPQTDNSTKFAFDLLLAIVGHEKLKQTNCLSQSIGGFNAALLSLQQIFQLPVLDILEEDSEVVSFSNIVGDMVLNYNRFGPLGVEHFNPLRAGWLKLNKLNILDNYGRRTQLDYDQPNQESVPQPPIVAEPLRTASTAHLAMPPRIVPPARLNFRWLAANSDQLEMNDHPATSPICGWVLPNFLDNSLMVYAQSGRALGYIDAGGNWRLFPGHLGPALPEAIDNPHLRRMVRWFCNKAQVVDNTSYMDELMQEIELALENIAPENSAQHQGLALLIGRPLALVRASIGLELKGETAYSQNWDFVQEYPVNGTFQYAPPTNYQFDQVQAPVRIGERGQLNDGMVFCWEENVDARDIDPDTYYQQNQYYASQTKSNVPDPIFYPTLEKDAQPFVLSILMDPKAVLHATSGVLPVKSISIPPDQYATALHTIEVAFYTGPLITDADVVKVGVPNEAGYHWAWTEKEQQGWRTISTTGHLQKDVLRAFFPSRADRIWTLLIQKNWIQAIDTETATTVPKDQRAAPPGLGAEYADIEPQIESILDGTHLNPFQSTASFGARQEIREGWLLLKPD